MAKYLDLAGLQILWDQIKSKFIDNDELSGFLADYEKITDLQRDYANRTELATILSGYATDEELAAAISQMQSDYVKGSITSTAGNARIFNEADGGGAKFENVDGTASFAGVNSDTNGGIGAQLYDITVSTNKGSKLDVTKNGIYYTKGDESAKSASLRDVEANELVVKKDIAGLVGGMHFIGSVVPEAGESLAQTIARLYATKGKSYADRAAGDIVIVNTPGISQEYICDSEKEWIELGSEGIYATKAELSAEEEAREAADSALETSIAGKLDLMPGDSHTSGNAYNLPYYFYTVPSASKVEVHTKTVTLDGNKTYGDYSLDVNSATSSAAGLMAAADKSKLDGIDSMTEAEIKNICK